MINAKICVKEQDDRLYWILSLSAIVKDKEVKKEIKGVELTKDFLSPIDTMFSMIKKESEIIDVSTNNIEILSFLNEYKGPHIITPSFNQLLEDEFSFEEIIVYSENENPQIPLYLNNTSLKKYDTDFENNLFVSLKLFRTYLFFLENQTKTHETKFIEELRKKKILPENILLEDIFAIIEDTLSEEG